MIQWYISLHKNFISIFSLFLLILTSILSLTSRDLLNLWFIMEINNFIFIFYFIISLKNKKIILLFFLIQVIRSFFIIISILIHFLTTINNFYLIHSIISFYGLILKIGRAPLHFWIPLLTPHLNWFLITIFFTIQKIIPITILTLTKPHSLLLTICSFSCIVIPPFIILNSTKFKKLLAYSSINQIGWIILIIFLNPKFWINYFIFYSLTLITIMYLIKINKIYFISYIKIYSSIKLLFIIRIINLSGVPPFSFFLIKWYRIFTIINLTTPNILVFLILFRSLIITFIYINIITKISFFYKINTKLLQNTIISHSLFNIIIFFILSFSCFLILS